MSKSSLSGSLKASLFVCEKNGGKYSCTFYCTYVCNLNKASILAEEKPANLDCDFFKGCLICFRII
jgi:Pyruvate/2-oxoacid:ferredoxin oxidoreductase delta subunit